MKILRELLSVLAANKSLLNFVGGLLGVAGLFFVFHELSAYWSEISTTDLSSDALLACLAVALFYGAANLLLAKGWHLALAMQKADLPSSEAIRIYSLSALGKYVPGNVFQFVGRQALAVSAGISNRAAARSTLWEFILLGLGALTLAPLVGALLLPQSSLIVWLALSLVLFVMCCWILDRRFDHALAAFASYLCFLVLSGLCFTALLIAIGGVAELSLGDIIMISAAYVTAWFVGMITPGAPAGLGIREAALTVLLASIAPAPLILLAVVISRATTVLGDTIFFVAGRFASNSADSSPASTDLPKGRAP